MLFSHLLGNSLVKQHLNHAVEKNTLANSLLFAGPSGVGKTLFAKELASALLQCPKSIKEHPDLHIYQPEGKSELYKIDTLREMLKEAQKPPFSAPKKVFILEEADRMPPVSSNALLKTLEEPEIDSFFILLTAYPSKILPTIVSRLSVFSFLPISKEEIEKELIENHQVPLPEAKEAARLSSGSLGKALEIAKQEDFLELRNLLLVFLEKTFQSWDEFHENLELVEQKLLQQKEVHKGVELFFSYIDLWIKDLYLMQEKIRKEHLHFPEAFDQPSSIKLPSFFQLESWLEKALISYQRGSKISTCLEYVFLQLGLL